MQARTLPPRDHEHRMAEVAAPDRRAAPGFESQQQIARPAAEIQDARAGHGEDRPHALDGAAAPGAVDVEREQMIQQIVAPRHGGEHAANRAGGLLFARPSCEGCAGRREHRRLVDAGDDLHLADPLRQDEMHLARAGSSCRWPAARPGSRRRCRPARGWARRRQWCAGCAGLRRPAGARSCQRQVHGGFHAEGHALRHAGSACSRSRPRGRGRRCARSSGCGAGHPRAHRPRRPPP